VKTTGVNQDPFFEEAARWNGWEDWKDTDLKVNWTVVDVGGQRSERRKWVGFFDNVQTVVFLVNALGYNEPLYEDESTLRMHESLTLFDTMFGPKSKGAFNRIPITVAFNKLDSFKETYSPEGMKRCFPDVPDASCKDADSAIEYIKQTFQDKCKNRQKPTLTHAYNAIDRSQCETLLRKVQKSIMEDAHGTGMLVKTTNASDKDLTNILSAVKAGASVPYDQIPTF
jgi:hypothetical protein